MISASDGADVKLFIETLDGLIRLKQESGSNSDLYNKIEGLESKIVDEISKRLHLQQ